MAEYPKELDVAVNYIWSRAEALEDRNPPDYYFSFARRHDEKLTGALSKDVRQSYVTAPKRSPETHPYAYGRKRIDDGTQPQDWFKELCDEDPFDFSAFPIDVIEDDPAFATRDMRHPDPTDHGSMEQRWEATSNSPRLTAAQRRQIRGK